MRDGDEELLFQFALPVPVSLVAAIGNATAKALARMGYECFIRDGARVYARKRYPANDLPVANYWEEPVALTDLDDRYAAWKDSEGYWWPAWYLPRDEEWKAND